jgi:Ca2+/Na+ antiporter
MIVSRYRDPIQVRLAPPASGAIVMGTGIVSIALAFDHVDVISSILLVVAALVWVGLGILLAGRATHDRESLRRDAWSPAALTGVAATAVLGARVIGLGWEGVAMALLVLATALWVALMATVRRRWKHPRTGVAFMVVVSTESLAVLAAELAAGEHPSWLLFAALLTFALGLVLYPFVLRGFDLRELVRGRGDQWVSGGALAISTLAAATIALAIHAVHDLESWAAALRTVSVVL